MKDMTYDHFDDKIKKGMILLDFYADWCGPCKMLTPVLETLSMEMKNVQFYKVNIDKEQELTERFQIQSVPTMILFKDGKVVGKTSGYSPKELIQGFIEKML